MYTNADITVYNRYLDVATRLDKYKRVVLKDVFWTDKKAVNKLKSGLETADSVSITIPFSVASDDEYIKPNEYQKLTNKEGYYTLSELDRVVKGEIDFEITGKLSDLDKDYEAFTITAVDTKDFGSDHMRHWKVGAK